MRMYRIKEQLGRDGLPGQRWTCEVNGASTDVEAVLWRYLCRRRSGRERSGVGLVRSMIRCDGAWPNRDACTPDPSRTGSGCGSSMCPVALEARGLRGRGRPRPRRDRSVPPGRRWAVPLGGGPDGAACKPAAESPDLTVRRSLSSARCTSVVSRPRSCAAAGRIVAPTPRRAGAAPTRSVHHPQAPVRQHRLLDRPADASAACPPQATSWTLRRWVA